MLAVLARGTTGLKLNWAMLTFIRPVETINHIASFVIFTAS